MTNSEKNLTRSLLRLSDAERQQLLSTSNEDLPNTLKELGISLPATNWVLRILKILLYGLGIVLAGVGTISCTSLFI